MFLLAFTNSFAAAQPYAKSFGGTAADQGNAVATDASGNLYIAGKFTGTATFSSAILISQGSEDIFISKFTPDGSLVWAKSYGSTGADEALSVNVAPSGSIYLSGVYGGAMTFGSSSITGKGGRDIFLAKLDADGDPVWAKGYGGTGDDRAYAVSLDAQENVYAGGIISVTTTNNAKIDFEGVELSSSGNYDMFIAKFDKDGGFKWVRGFGSTGDDRVHALVADDLGNIYATGLLVGTVNFVTPGKTESVTSRGGEDTYVLKMDTSGDVVWIKNFGGPNQEYGMAIDLDSEGNIYSTGFFQTTANFDTGSGNTSFTTTGNRDIYISKLNPSGDLIWARQLSGGQDDRGLGIKVAVDGNVYAVGYTSQTTAVYKFMAGPRPSAFYLDNIDQGENAYITKLNSNGDFLWLKGIGGAAGDRALGLVTDISNRLYVTGYIGGNATYDEVETLTSVGGNDGFLVKINPDGTLPVHIAKFDGYNLSGINYLHWTTLSETNNQYFDIERSVDGIGFSAIKRIAGAGNSSQKLQYQYADDKPLSGNNYYRLRQIDYNGDFSFSNVVLLKNQLSAQSISAYPNPGRGMVNISSTEVKDVKVYNSTGNLVLESAVNAFDITSQPNGVYLIKVNTGNQEQVIRFVKSAND